MIINKENGAALADEELAQVSGGTEPGSGSGGGGYFPPPAGPSTPTTPGKPTECIVIPVKGEETDHIDMVTGVGCREYRRAAEPKSLS